METKNKRGIRRVLILLILFIIVITLVLSFVKIDAIIINSYFSKEPRKICYLKDGEMFGVVYTHSVERSETSEWYLADNGTLVLMEQRYRDQGAGLPVDLIYKFKYTDDGSFCLYDMQVPFETVTYRTGAVRANHRLSINGKETPFLEFSKPREALEFSTQRISILKFLFRRCQIGR